jgi:hypothetical protein
MAYGEVREVTCRLLQLQQGGWPATMPDPLMAAYVVSVEANNSTA